MALSIAATRCGRPGVVAGPLLAVAVAVVHALLFLAVPVGCVSDVTTSPSPNLPLGAYEAALNLTLRGPTGSPLFPVHVVVAPLTTGLGLSRRSTSIDGFLVPANLTNYGAVDNQTISYLCCDPAPNGTISPSELLDNIITATITPRAILLYSLHQNYCSLEGAYTYDNVFTMVDSGDANTLLGWLDGAAGSPGPFQALLTGNSTSEDGVYDSSQFPISREPTTVAMSILYSITGLVTIMFLFMIGAGAIRARRHPERYGPRRAAGGRPRQSRARGLALAMLETLPVVKFRGPDDPAQDLEMKTENAGRGDDPASQQPSATTDPEPVMRGADQVPALQQDQQQEQEQEQQQQEEEQQQQQQEQQGHGRTEDRPAVATGHPPADEQWQAHPGELVVTLVEAAASAEQQMAARQAAEKAAKEAAAKEATAKAAAKEAARAAAAAEQSGCSICTEDFIVGEDVRVLPCYHQFHPACIDPWLLNVSGTCPLCRLDLRHTPLHDHSRPPPQRQQRNGAASAGPSRRRRLSQFFGPGNQGSAQVLPEESMLALRQLSATEEAAGAASAADGAVPQPPSDEAAGEQQHSRSRLTRRLREAFRVRTHTHSAAGLGEQSG